MADRTSSVAALVLAGVMLVALAVGVGSTWIDDGDGTCGAVYKPNFGRIGCSSKLTATGTTSAVLVGCAVLAWDAARSARRRPSRGAAVIVGIGIVAVGVLFAVRSGMDRQRRASRPEAPAVTGPQPRATTAP